MYNWYFPQEKVFEGEEEGKELSDLGFWEKEDKKQGEMQQVKTFEIVIFVAQILIISYESNM